MANIIRKSLEDFNAVKSGTVYFDESTDRLSDVFFVKRSAYFVLDFNGEIAGGAGFFEQKDCLQIPVN